MKSRLKALTGYPIFILTLISLITLTTVTLNILDTLYNERIQHDNEIMLEYTVIDGKMYLRTNAEPPLKIIYVNDGEQVIFNKSIYNNYYGPIIPRNTEMIIIGYRNNKPVIIDVLKPLRQILKITGEINGIYPPTISIDTVNGEVEAIQQIGVNKYYVLKPIIYRVNRSFIRGTYRVFRNGSIIHVDYSTHDIIYWNTSTEENISRIAEKDAKQYGNITLESNITLHNYLEEKYTINPITRILTSVSDKLPVVITYRTILDHININDTRIIHVYLKHVVYTITLTDNLGNNYPWKAEINYKLILVDDNGDIIASNTSTSRINHTPATILITGRFQVNKSFTTILYIEYYISTDKPVIGDLIYGSTYFTVEAGENENTYLEKLLTDKIKIMDPQSNKQVCTIVALINNTVIPVNISWEYPYNQSIYIGGRGFAGKYHILLEKQYVEPQTYKLVVHPSITIIHPENIALEKTMDETIIYDIGENITGIYYPYIDSRSTSITETIYPYLKSSIGDIIVIRDRETLYLLRQPNKTIIYHNNRETYTGRIDELYGFIILDEKTYQYPILIIHDPTPGIKFNITIEYSNTMEKYMVYNSSTIFLKRNTIIYRIHVEAYPSQTKSIPVQIHRSISCGVFIISLNNKVVIEDPGNVETIEVFSTKTYVITINNTRILFKE